jgi:hypothetical protein
VCPHEVELVEELLPLALAHARVLLPLAARDDRIVRAVVELHLARRETPLALDQVRLAHRERARAHAEAEGNRHQEQHGDERGADEHRRELAARALCVRPRGPKCVVDEARVDSPRHPPIAIARAARRREERRRRGFEHRLSAPLHSLEVADALAMGERGRHDERHRVLILARAHLLGSLCMRPLDTSAVDATNAGSELDIRLRRAPLLMSERACGCAWRLLEKLGGGSMDLVLGAECSSRRPSARAAHRRGRERERARGRHEQCADETRPGPCRGARVAPFGARVGLQARVVRVRQGEACPGRGHARCARDRLDGGSAMAALRANGFRAKSQAACARDCPAFSAPRCKPCARCA